MHDKQNAEGLEMITNRCDLGANPTLSYYLGLFLMIYENKEFGAF